MSSLFKTLHVKVDNKGKRVIDTNELIELKLEKLRQEEQQRMAASFVPGLDAESADGEGYIGEGAGNADGLDGILMDGDGFSEENAGGRDEVFQEGIVIADTITGVSSEKIIEESNAKAHSIIEDAKKKAEDILNDAMVNAETQKESILAEARELGYQDGCARAQEEYNAKLNELENKEKELIDEYEKLFDAMEPELVAVITDVYQHVFDVDLSNHKDIVSHLVFNTLRRIDGAKSFLVHVSSEDYEDVSVNKTVLEQACTVPGSVVEIIEDISLGKSACFVETDGGIFDCSLDEELSELKQKIRLLSYDNN